MAWTASSFRGPSTAANSTASAKDRRSFGLQNEPLCIFPASLGKAMRSPK